MNPQEARTTLEAAYANAEAVPRHQAMEAFLVLRGLLTSGAARAAEPVGDGWQVNEWVKKGILVGFRLGGMEDFSTPPAFSFHDKSTFPPRRFQPDEDVRVVPGGSTVRVGTHVAAGVICMPPMYINVGAYVDEGTLVDSHALVGSCAQIGKRVHLSAGAQIGGVLEPVGAQPVIVEDGALVGGNCGVYEGTRVGRDAVLAAGTILTRSTPIHDLVEGRMIRATADEPLTVPPRAVIVPGSRPARGGEADGIHLYTPVLVKYRDQGTDAAAALEDALR